MCWNRRQQEKERDSKIMLPNYLKVLDSFENLEIVLDLLLGQDFKRLTVLEARSGPLAEVTQIRFSACRWARLLHIQNPESVHDNKV